MIGAGNDDQFARLCAAIGLEPEDRFATNELRVKNRAAVREALEERLRTAPRAHWQEKLRAASVPAGPVQTIGEAFSLAESLGLDVVDETDGVRTVAFPARLSRTPARVRLRPPDLGEHTDELRRG
jgi:crotonobetainyl-CoA:carnitine CoA-transferase CaiB-like acyl-CoA transferase